MSGFSSLILLRALTEHHGGGRIPEGGAPQQVGSDDDVRGGGRDGLQPLLAGVVQHPKAVNLHPVHHQRGDIGQVLPVSTRQRRMRTRIGRAYGADAVAVRGSQWYSRVKADVRVTVLQRAVAKAVIVQSIGYAQDLHLCQRMVEKATLWRCR